MIQIVIEGDTNVTKTEEKKGGENVNGDKKEEKILPVEKKPDSIPSGDEDTEKTRLARERLIKAINQFPQKSTEKTRLDLARERLIKSTMVEDTEKTRVDLTRERLIKFPPRRLVSTPQCRNQTRSPRSQRREKFIKNGLAGPSQTRRRNVMMILRRSTRMQLMKGRIFPRKFIL